MRFIARILPALLVAPLLSFCSSIEIKNRYDRCEKIVIGPGVEDFALLEKGNETTILVSSHDRRAWKQPGGIFAFNLKTRKATKLDRKNEPNGVFFAPHGIDIFRSGQDTFLYVVNHGVEMDDNDQSILIYALRDGALEFVVQIRDDLINSPNDLSVTDTGSFYVTNDHGSRGSMWELFWGLKRSKVVYCTLTSFTANAGATCRTAAKDIAMANGVLAIGGKVFVSATREGRVYEFPRNADGSLGEKALVADVSGPDNLFPLDKQLITASHTSNWKFFRHVSSAENKSPSYIVSIDPAQKTVAGLYFDAGKEISAASGAFVYKRKLYISQVFEDFLLECKPVP